MSITIAQFQTYPFADSFSKANPAKLQALLDFVDRNYCQGAVWKSNPISRIDALVLIAAHMGYLQWFAEADIANAAIALRENGSGRSNPTALDEYFKLTIYGSQYLDLQNQVRAIQVTSSTKPAIHTGFAF